MSSNKLDIDSILKNTIAKTIESTKQSLNESYVHEPKPFKQVSELIGQKTKDAHTELYKDYIKNLNAVSFKLDTAERNNTNSMHSDFRSLKLDEAYNLNAVWLHELYFANCFDPHSEIAMDSIPYLKLQRDFGTFEDWQRDYIACAETCGNGWAVCGYNIFLKRYINTIISNHSQDVMIGLYPVVVIDMWEHSYSRNYLNDKKSYIIANMRELNWTVIEERFKRAEVIGTAVSV